MKTNCIDIFNFICLEVRNNFLTHTIIFFLFLFCLPAPAFAGETGILNTSGAPDTYFDYRNILLLVLLLLIAFLLVIIVVLVVRLRRETDKLRKSREYLVRYVTYYLELKKQAPDVEEPYLSDPPEMTSPEFTKVINNMLKRITFLSLLTFLALPFAGCNKDDDPQPVTPHPDRGAVVVTADWSGRSSDAVVPGSYELCIGDKKQTVKLEFQHLLSKIEVVLVQGNGTPTISKVEILNTKLGAKFTPSKIADFSVAAEGEVPTEGNPIMIDNGTTSAENAARDVEANKVLNEAIIVPQRLADGTTFIRITTTDGGVQTYSLEEETTFASGSKYRYTITANLTGLTVSSAISPWGDGSNTSGTAEM